MRVNKLLVAVALMAGAVAGARGAEAGSAGGDLAGRLDALKGRLGGWKDQLDLLRGRGEDVSYPLVTYTTIEEFVARAGHDLSVFSPEGWGWMAINGSQSSCVAVKEGRTGAHGMRIVNKSGYMPNRYGMLQYSGVIGLTAGKAYTFSAWVKGPGDGVSLAAGGGWQFRVGVPKGDGWRRVELTFTPGAGDCAFQPRVLSEKEVEGAVVDDLCLVEGAAAEAGKNLIGNPSFEAGYTQRRASYEVSDMEGMASRLDAELKAAVGGEAVLPEVPRWTGTERPRVEGVSMVGPTATMNHPERVERRPIFFIGYGHFFQTRADVPRFPGFGTNMVQNGEFGPSSLYPKEGEKARGGLEQLEAELRAGRKAGVGVDWLLSPHYFPGWVFAKYPGLHVARADFFPYSLYRPEVMGVLRAFCRDVLSEIKDEPALVSVCLSNEPNSLEEPSDASRAVWRKWLAKRHGDIRTLNARWGTSYKSFEEVPQPNPFGAAVGEKRPSGAWCDEVRFQQETFADWHKQLAEAVHAVAPEVPVHVKVTTWFDWRAEQVQASVDPFLLSGCEQLMGNDSFTMWGYGQKGGKSIWPPERADGVFAQGWIENALAYDLLRSVKDAPVFNSENHFILDRDTRPVDPAHFRAALWQQAVHGQSVTTQWVWERSDDAGGDFAGNIGDHAACVEAYGRTCLDLNRIAREMTAVQAAPADVDILQSSTAAVWDGGGYQDCLVKLYAALEFCGVKVGFITERQLEAGILPSARVVLVPGVRHLSDAAYGELEKYTGKVVAVGEGGALSRNEYDAGRAEAVKFADRVGLVAGKTSWEDVWKEVSGKLGGWGVRPVVEVTGEDGGRQEGVQWAIGKMGDGGVVVSLYNPWPGVRRVKVDRDGVDCLSGEAVGKDRVVEMTPLEVRMVRVK